MIKEHQFWIFAAVIGKSECTLKKDTIQSSCLLMHHIVIIYFAFLGLSRGLLCLWNTGSDLKKGFFQKKCLCEFILKFITNWHVFCSWICPFFGDLVQFWVILGEITKFKPNSTYKSWNVTKQLESQNMVYFWRVERQVLWTKKLWKHYPFPGFFNHFI